jgi:hypothetical protein
VDKLTSPALQRGLPRFRACQNRGDDPNGAPRALLQIAMTTYWDHRIWQDVHHVPSDAVTLYVKFTADVVTEFLLLSFKGKDDE